MLKGFLSGLAVSALALAALSLAFPITPDPAAGSPAPEPVLTPGASLPPEQVGAGLALAALPAAREALPVATPRPAILPPPAGAEAPAFPVDMTALPRPIIDAGQRQSALAEETTALQRGPSPPMVLAAFLAPQSPVWTAGPTVEPRQLDAPASSPPRPILASSLDLRSERLPQIGAPPPLQSEADRSPARVRHAMPVARTGDERPMLGVVVTYAGVLPDLPVTLALDPLAGDAAETARAWRDLGREVAILATGLPAGADARDIEVTLQNHLRSLPDAVALVDLPEGGIARDRVLAAQTVAILAEGGHGLVTYASGLNAAARMAESADVAAVTATERIVAGDDPAARRRALDRAALRAAQEGQALIFVEGSAEVMETLGTWLETTRGRELDAVPLSMLLNR